MSGLSALKFVASKPQQGNSPKHARRQKLINKIHEQIQLAKAAQSGTEYVPVRIRSVRDEATGGTQKVEVPKRLKPWWWASENGRLFITVRYGARTLEVIEGKNAIEAENIAGVITSLEVLRSVIDAGELDARIEAVSRLAKAGFDKEAALKRRPTLKLSVKAD